MHLRLIYGLTHCEINEYKKVVMSEEKDSSINTASVSERLQVFAAYRFVLCCFAQKPELSQHFPSFCTVSRPANILIQCSSILNQQNMVLLPSPFQPKVNLVRILSVKPSDHIYINCWLLVYRWSVMDKQDKCIVLRIGTLTGCPLCRESHPLCRLKNPTVISIWLLVGFHPATRSVQCTPADNARKRAPGSI